MLRCREWPGLAVEMEPGIHTTEDGGWNYGTFWRATVNDSADRARRGNKKKSKKITVISHGQKRVPNGRVLRAGTVYEMIAAMEIQTSSKRYRRK